MKPETGRGGARRAARLLAAILLIGAAAIADGHGAPPSIAGETEDEGVFFDRVQVEVINVDVVVTDRQGRAVNDLQRGDFEIFEDGVAVELTHFAAVDAEAPGAARHRSVTESLRAAEGAGVPPGATARSVDLTAPEDGRLALIVFVDNVNIRAVNRNRVFRDLQRFLQERLGPNDRAMLVSYERALKIKQPFTSEWRLLTRGLRELEELSTNSAQAERERRDLVRSIEEARSPSQIRSWLTLHAQSVQNDLVTTLAALREMVDSLAGVPGRKALLYVSDGLPMTPGEEFFIAVQNRFPQESFLLDARAFDASRSYRELAHEANSNRVSFYNLDAAGVRVSSAIDVERDRGGPSADFYINLDFATVSNLHGSLKYLAELTGGAAIVNTNNFSTGLARMGDDFDRYYSLGYAARHGGDGRYHRIEVRTGRQGLRVRHREGYRDKPMSTRMAEATMSALRWGMEGRNDLGLALRFGSGAKLEGGQSVVSMVVSIPIDRLTLVPRGEEHVGQIRLFVAVADADARTAPIQEVPVAIRIPSAELARARQHTYDYEIPLKIRLGNHRIAVGAQDEISAAEGFAAETISGG